MEMQDFINALEKINCAIAQVIGAMQGTMAKKMPTKTTQQIYLCKNWQKIIQGRMTICQKSHSKLGL